VLAGVRRPEDAPPGLEPLVLDVTSERDVAAAAAPAGGTLIARALERRRWVLRPGADVNGAG
jgi:hypothetical protein